MANRRGTLFPGGRGENEHYFARKYPDFAPLVLSDKRGIEMKMLEW